LQRVRTQQAHRTLSQSGEKQVFVNDVDLHFSQGLKADSEVRIRPCEHPNEGSLLIYPTLWWQRTIIRLCELVDDERKLFTIIFFITHS